MFRKIIVPNVLLLLAIQVAIAADAPDTPATLTAAQVVEKNVAARGGLQAWKAVQTLSMSGKLEAGGTQNTELPFSLEMKRPRKSRLELKFNGQTAVQVYDGSNGWKLRPFLNRHQVEPYTAEELKAASMQAELDGPLVDYNAKGTKLELAGVQPVEGRQAYNLKLTLKNGQVQHVWVDAQTFLDVKVEGTPRRLDGKYRPVETYLRDYRPVKGLMVAYVLETSVEGAKRTEKIRIDNVVVNPKLEDSHFTKPQ
jgi:outer membrane lipoprotein-sorting protein